MFEKKLWVLELQKELIKQKDELKGKDMAINALSETLMEKASENHKQAEIIRNLRDSKLSTHILE